MSFSQDIKSELVKFQTPARHCQIAELAAILVYSESIKPTEDGVYIEPDREETFVIPRCNFLIEKLFNGNNNIEEIKDKILQTIKYVDDEKKVSPLVIKSLCCKRAYLRGAFISVGCMSNPEKGYHLEFVCSDMDKACQLVETLIIFDITAKIIQRKKYYVVYIKESEEIVELLNVIGAHVSLMKLENLRILKDMRNSINRRVNCEAANITKTVNAATKQIDDIEYIKKHYGFENLAPNLREVAALRLEYPEATLKELGGLLGVGKSGVNHRLRKLSELADGLRQE